VVQVEEPQLYHIEYIVSPEKCRLRLRGNNNSNTYLEPTEPEVKGYTYVRTSPSFFFLFLDRGAQPEIETKQSAMRSKGCVVNFIYPENSLSLSVQDLRISGSRDLLPAALHIWQKFEPLHCTPFHLVYLSRGLPAIHRCTCKSTPCPANYDLDSRIHWAKRMYFKG